MGLAVSKYSRYREEAVATACCLTSEAVERERASVTGAVPTRPNLYGDPAALSQTPFFGRLSQQVIDGLVARPSRAAGLKYDAVSRTYAQWIHSALGKKCSVDAALDNLERELARLTG